MKFARRWKLLGFVTAIVVAAGYYLFPVGAADPGATPSTVKKNAYIRFAEQLNPPALGEKTPTALQIGDKLPALKCTGFDGRPIDIDTLYGEKATLIVCWSTWCHPCMEQVPHEIQLSRAFKALGLKVIGVNSDEDAARATAAASAFGMDWPTIHDPRGNESPAGIVKTLGIKSWPTLLLFDANRQLIATSPHLTSITTFDIGNGDQYAVRFLDLTLTRLLGPLPYVQYVTPTN